MKYFFRIILVLLLCTGVVWAMYYYTGGGTPLAPKNTTVLTTVTKPAATEKNANRVLLAALEKEDYALYKGSKGIVLVHGKNEYEFDNWSRFIGEGETTLHLADFDGDGAKELLVRAVGAQNESGDFLYDLYLLKATKDENGQDKYSVIHASQSTYLEIVNKKIREEINQLTCKKFMQFSMTTADKSIAYDSKTGLAKNSGYSGYFRAVQDKNGNYLALDEWKSGDAVYTVSDDGKISVEADITVTYKDAATVQNAGKLYFELSLDEKGSFFVTSRTMVFKTDKRYLVSDPNAVAEEPWSYAENNADKSLPAGAKTIDWIKFTPQYRAGVYEQTQSFAQSDTDNNLMAKVYLTESYVELTAKSGCTFDSSAQQKREYSVIINKGTDSEYEIAYTSSVTEKNGQEVLRIHFDKAYPQSEVKTVELNFGAK